MVQSSNNPHTIIAVSRFSVDVLEVFGVNPEVMIV
jgi:hypothetical protein